MVAAANPPVERSDVGAAGLGLGAVERPDVGAAGLGLGALVAAGAGVTLWEAPEPQAASNMAISR